MKSYLTYSFAVHGLFLAALIVVGTLLSKPRMSYYAVDLVSSMPAGGGSTPGPQVTAESPTVPKVSAPKVVAPPAPAPRAAEEELPDQDTIRMLAKLKKKRLAQPKDRYRDSSAQSPESSSERAVPAQGSGRGGSGLPGSGSGIVAEAGTAFPFPWYLKAIADRLDKQWHPPQEFAGDTMCQVTFIINRAGEISGSQLSKSSRDSLFDQLALRAVLYSNPMPPLPNGFPDETLKVHMKFVGRRM